MDSCKLIRRILEAEGHHVLTCNDPDAAHRLVRANAPDLVIVHVGPGTRGIPELTRRIKDTCAGCSILTICDHIPEVMESATGDDFVIKPVDVETIESKVREILANKEFEKKEFYESGGFYEA